MATYFFQTEGYNTNTQTTVAHKYNNDTGIWTTIASPPVPAASMGTAADNLYRQEGGWDGNYWYAILLDGKLYRYTPDSNTWSSALATGTVFTSIPASGQSWYMESDGRFLYVWTNTGFRRYDPVNDTLLALQDSSGGNFGPVGALEYDGIDTLFAIRGAVGETNFQKYTISTATWTTLASPPAVDDVMSRFFAYLGGRFWRLVQQTGVSLPAYMFIPSGTVGIWAQKAANTAPAGVNYVCAAGEVDDSTVRIWNFNSAGSAVDYNVSTDTWAVGPPSTWRTRPGNNFAVARVFNPSFVWDLSDGTTQAGASVNLGSVVVGETLNFQLKVTTPTARGAGVTVSVPVLPSLDAEDPVTICGTAGGTYATSFVTAGLAAGQQFDVFVRVMPTTAQTLGFTKTFNLKVNVN